MLGDTLRNLRLQATGRQVDVGITEAFSRSAFGRFSDTLRERIRNNKLSLFFDGGQPFVPKVSTDGTYTETDLFIYSTIADEVKDIFDGTGNVLSGQQETYERIAFLAPRLIDIFTSPDFIRLVQEDHFFDLIRMAIRKAADPQTTISLRVGIGGSDSSFTPERLMAYVVPALEITTSIDDAFEEYRVLSNKQRIKVFEGIALDRLYQRFEKEHGPVGEGNRRNVVKELAKTPNLLDNLRDDERKELAREINSYDPNTVKIEFLFATNSAIAVNGTNSKEEKDQNHELMWGPGIVLRSRESAQALINFAARYNLDRRTVILEDKPWESFSPYERTLLEYMGVLLEKSNDPVIKHTLDTLKGTGRNHGGGKGADNAHNYAALHVLFFGDDLRIPGVRGFFDSVPGYQPDFRVTLGGDAERHFNRMRAYLKQHVSVDGITTFIQQKLSGLRRNSNEYVNLVSTLEALKIWQQRNPDFIPKSSVALITPTKRAPYYPEYYSEGHPDNLDRPLGDLSLYTVRGKIEELRRALKQFEGNCSGLQRTEGVSKFNAIIADYITLEKALTRLQERNR